MKQRRTPDELSGLKLSYKTIVSWAGAIVVVVAGGTFAVTKLSTSSHVSALKTELDGAKEREKRKDAEIQGFRDSATGVKDSFAQAATLPDTTLIGAEDSDSVIAGPSAAPQSERFVLWGKNEP